METGGIITFEEKASLFSQEYLQCCLFLMSGDAPQRGHEFSKKLFSKFISTSKVLENFLDFHGAKNNRDWFFYRELSAAIRHLSLSGYALKHILNRLIYYCLKDTADFEAESQVTLDFLTQTLTRMSPIIVEEARKRGISVPEKGFDATDFPGIATGERLAHDVTDAGDSRQKKHVVKIANEFLNVADHFDEFAFYEPYTLIKVRELVPDSVNEVEIRRFEMLVHNLQSSFDTYVVFGGYGCGEDSLRELRSHFSVVYHILKMMGRLLHFYERHLHEVGFKDMYKKVRDQLKELIDPDILLDRTVNYGLYYTCHFLTIGKEVAREILNENIDHDFITVGIPVSRGFHSRPCLLVAKVVQHYGGQVEMRAGDGRFDASSVLDLQWAGGKIQNENITQVVFEGDTRALLDLEILAGVNYGEDYMGNGIPLPRELKYLRE